MELNSTEIVNNIEEGKQNLEEISEAVAENPGLLEQYFSEFTSKLLGFCMQVIIALIVYLIGVKLIKVVRKVMRKALERRDADQGVIQFLDSLVKAACYVILVLIILTMFGVTTASVVAILGSAGLAIGMSLQGSLSNFAGGVLILLLKPFRVGDYIVEGSGNQEGTVTEISIFYTKLMTVDNKIVILPNGKLSDSSITNVTAQEIRRLIIKVGISYDSDIKKAKELMLTLAENDSDSLKEQPMEVYVDELAESSVNLGLRFFVKTENYWNVKWRLTEQIKDAFDENDIEIPYNKIDVNIQNVRS